MISLKDKKILITGASSGIGRSTAILLSSLGAELLLTGRNMDALQETGRNCSGKFHLFSADLAIDKDVQSLVKLAEDLSGWVHCAGKVLPVPVKFIQEKHLKEIFDVNFSSAVKLSAVLLQQKKLKDAASIVFISSVSVMHSYFGGGPYVASKAALEGYARTLALELSSRKIRVNVLRPALVKTQIYEQTKKATQNEQEFMAYEKKYPLGIGNPEDIANACAFFLSDASQWITGSFLKMDGGLTTGGTIN